MQYRRLGVTSIEVSRLGLGTVTFGREIDEAESFALLDHALASGIGFLDTAESYGGGQARLAREKAQGFADTREISGEFHSSELIIGRWLKSRKCRQSVTLQTKLLPPLTRSRITTQIDESLTRLQSDHVDVYLAHAFDPATPIEETLEGFAAVKRAGKVREAGCSNFDASQLRQALCRSDIASLTTVQSNYNLVIRDIESELLPLCQSRGVGVQTYSPLGAGFLTGKYTDRVAGFPSGSRFDVSPAHADIYFDPEKFRMIRQLQQTAAELGVPAPQLAVAWVLANPLVDCVLIGARKTAHIDSALRALEMHLSDEVLHRLGGSNQSAAG